MENRAVEKQVPRPRFHHRLSVVLLFLVIACGNQSSSTSQTKVAVKVGGRTVGITFLLLGLVGWAPGARVVRSGIRSLAASDCALQAKAAGCGAARLALVHLLPQLRPLVISQFWLAIPAFLLAEANLGMLGLGVAEPMPSLGNSLAELSNIHSVAAAPWTLAPAAVLLVVLTCLHLVLGRPSRFVKEGGTQ